MIAANLLSISALLPAGQAFFRDLPPLPDGRQVSLALGSLGECDTGGRLWPPALLMCRWLCEQEDDVRDRSIMELGCGTGAVGMYAAALGARLVCLSDGQDAVLNLARTNVNANLERGMWSSEQTTVDVRSLTWGQPELPALIDTSYDLILGSCITYTSELHAPLCTSLRALLSPPGDEAAPRVVLSHDKRVIVPSGVLEADFPDATLEHLIRVAAEDGLRVRAFYSERVGGRLVSLLEVTKAAARAGPTDSRLCASQ